MKNKQTTEERVPPVVPPEIMSSPKTSTSSRPPGPRGPPLIGQAFNLDTSHMHHQFMEWQKVHGDFFMFKILGKHFVVISHPDILRKMFDTEKYRCRFNDRPASFMGSYVIGETKDIIFRSYDEKQRQIKNAAWCYVEHTIKSEKWFYECVAEECTNIVKKINSLKDKPVNLLEILDLSSAKIIGLLVSTLLYFIRHDTWTDDSGQTSTLKALGTGETVADNILFPWAQTIRCTIGGNDISKKKKKRPSYICKNSQQMIFWNVFPFSCFSQIIGMIFHLEERQFAWLIKTYFVGKLKTISICRLFICPEDAIV